MPLLSLFFISHFSMTFALCKDFDNLLKARTHFLVEKRCVYKFLGKVVSSVGMDKILDLRRNDAQRNENKDYVSIFIT